MLIQTRSDFDRLLASVRASDILVFDVEATGLALRHGDTVVGLALYTSIDDAVWYVPLAHGCQDVPVLPVETTTKTGKPRKLTQKAQRQLAMNAYAQDVQPAVRAANVPRAWLAELAEAWARPAVHIAHNAQFDLTAVVEQLDLPLPSRVEDTMAMLSAINPDWRGSPKDGYAAMFRMPDTGQMEAGSRSLKWQARLWALPTAGEGEASLRDAVARLADRLAVGGGVLTYSAPQEVLWMLDPADAALYATEDVRLTYQLWRKINARADERGVAHLCDLYNEVTVCCWLMQHEGFRFDRAEALRQRASIEAERGALAEKIATATGGLITNPASPAQVAAYLAAISVQTASGKTDKASLSRMDGVPVTHDILRYRSLGVLLNTFIEKWLSVAYDDRIRPEYNVGGTSTGRLTSGSEQYGNLQNVPRDEARDANPKRLLCAPEGLLLVEIDYSTLEMRIAAWVAETLLGQGRDLTLTHIIEADEDMHLHTMHVSGIADLLLQGRTPEQYLRAEGYDLDKLDTTPEKYFIKKVARAKAKTTNFAAAYGAGVAGIRRAVGCSEDEAFVLLEGYRKAYPALVKAMSQLERGALAVRPIGSDAAYAQYIRYPLRGLDLVRYYDVYPTHAASRDGGTWNPQEKAARGAFNSVIQGTGGLMMLKAIVRVRQEIGFARRTADGYDTSAGVIVPLGTVHDSFVFAVRPEDAGVVQRVCDILTDYDIRPRLAVEVSVTPTLGGSWGSVEKVEDVAAWAGKWKVESGKFPLSSEAGA